VVGGFLAEFEISINTWAGRTTLILEDDVEVRNFQLDIDPHDKKLSLGAWNALIDELSSVSTSLPWGLSPGGAEGRTTVDALATVHPAIIENLISPFLRLLRLFVSQPPIRTIRKRAFRPLDFSRAADLRTLRSLSRRPLVLAKMRGLGLDAKNTDGGKSLLDQPENGSSLDHPVTRYFAFLLDKVGGRLQSTSEALRRPAGHGVSDPGAKTYAGQLADRVDKAWDEIRNIRSAAIFCDIQPEAFNETALQALPDHPLYLAIHRIGRQLAAPGLAYAPGQEILSALKHSYDLFELAVLYRLVAALKDILGPKWSVVATAPITRLPHEDRPSDRSSWCWTNGSNDSVELVYQALFKAASSSESSDGYESISGQYVPDFALIFRRAGKPASWLILDAKYRSGRKSIHEGLGDVHRYRDALRVSGLPAYAAYIVVPALQQDVALYGTQDYRAHHKFGAISLYAADWVLPIRDWLTKSARPPEQR
jgi:hypothetical protein